MKSVRTGSLPGCARTAKPVTVRYEDDKPVAVEKLVAAVAHSEETSAEQVRQDVIERVFKPVLAQYKLALPTDENITVNGTGLWHIPGRNQMPA